MFYLRSLLVNPHRLLSDTLKPLSKNQRRKALRYGKLSEGVSKAISLAVRKYLGG
jgi:hypothetical protein